MCLSKRCPPMMTSLVGSSCLSVNHLFPPHPLVSSHRRSSRRSLRQPPPHLSPFLMNHARDGQQPSRPSSRHARSCRPRRRRCAESPDAVSPSQSGSGQISPASCSSLCRATLMSRDPSELSGKQSHLIRPALCIGQHFLSVWERSLRL